MDCLEGMRTEKR